MSEFIGCKHSEKLQEYFDIEARGIDFINDYGLKFEFKESFAKDKRQMFFKIPHSQVINADFLVFCVYDKEFYVHNTKYIVAKYTFNNGYERACLRYSTIRKNFYRKFDNYNDLQEFIYNIREGL